MVAGQKRAHKKGAQKSSIKLTSIQIRLSTCCASCAGGSEEGLKMCVRGKMVRCGLLEKSVEKSVEKTP